MRKFLFALALPFVLCTGIVMAADSGTPEEAKAMLEKAVAELKADKAKALAMFNEGAGGFKDRDLYVYCGGPDGTFTAHINEKLRGASLKELKDKDGKAFGEEIYAVAEPEKIAEVEYKWNRPDSEELVEKVAYVTQVEDEICAVGYYK